MANRKFWLILGGCVACLGAIGACSARPKLDLGGTCDLTTDCAAPYVCRLDACRQECREVRDCGPGQLCVQDSEGFGVCQTDEERECTRDNDCAVVGLECRFGTCTNGCAMNRDCFNGLVCAEESAGVLACMDPTTKECVLNSDCDDPLICARDQRCREECRERRDCRDGKVCGMDRGFRTCVAEMMDAGTDGATDAGTDGAMDGGVDSALDGALDSGADADGATALVPATAPSAALSTRHGCSLGGGGLRCWGQNDLGQIGVGTASAVIVLPTDITFPAAATPRWHAAGLNHTCALADSVHCWGSNANLQLGVASGLVYQPSAVVPLPAGIVGIAAGGSHNCAWTRTSIHCWGANGEGQLGSGAPADSWMPNSLAIGGDVIQMALGDAHTCALRADGQVLCWGNNSTWELGDGTTMDRLPPTANLVTGAVSLEAGPSHTCAVLSGGGVTCWGLNDVGQLGGGAADPFRTGRGPTAVADVTAAVQVTVGAAHTCVLESGGTVKCFGSNGSGRCGAAASTFQVLDPFAPAFTGPVAAVWATAEGTCAELGAGGGTECIGNNRGGAFGFDSGAITNVGPTPVSVTW